MKRLKTILVLIPLVLALIVNALTVSASPVFTSPEDFTPCVLVNSPRDYSVVLETPDGWFNSTELPDWAILTHCNFVHDETAQYYEYEFVVKSTARELGENVTVLYDEEGDAWWGVVDSNVVISNETIVVASGTLSLKVVDSGLRTDWKIIEHTFSVVQDWTGYDFIAFYAYFVGDGNTTTIHFIVANSTRQYAEFLIDFSQIIGKWAWIVLPLRHADLYPLGVPDLSTVQKIRFSMSPSYNVGTFYVDRIVLIKAGWTYLEFFVPDSGFISDFWVWNSTVGAWVSVWGSPGSVVTLSGHSFEDIYGGAYGLALSPPTARGENFTSWDWGDVNAPITSATSLYGTLKRQIIALKLPPYSDLSQINEIKFKVRICYVTKPAIVFDGINDYVEVQDSDSLDLTTDLLIEVGLKVRELSSTLRDIVVKAPSSSWINAPYRFGLQNGKLVFIHGNGTTYESFVSTTALATQTEYQIAVSASDGFYINGQLDKSFTPTIGWIKDTSPVRIGLNPSASSANCFCGVIYYVRIYNTTELQAQGLNATYVIEHNYAHPDNPVTDGLVLWLSADSYNGTHLLDKSGLSNHGAVYGAKVFNYSSYQVSYVLEPSNKLTTSLFLRYYGLYNVYVNPRVSGSYTISILHPATKANLTFVFDNVVAGKLCYLEKDGVIYPTRIVPTDLAQTNGTFTVKVASGIPVITEIQNGNLTTATYDLSIKKLVGVVDAPAGTTSVVVIYSPWRPVKVVLSDGYYRYSGNYLYIYLRHHSPATFTVYYSGSAEIQETFEKIAGSLGLLTIVFIVTLLGIALTAVAALRTGVADIGTVVKTIITAGVLIVIGLAALSILLAGLI